MIKSISSVWDETIALPPCAIGEMAALARRRGHTWFLAILNGPTARTTQIPLAFLGTGKYQALVIRDQPENAAAVRIENTSVSRDDALVIELRAGGGFMGRFTRSTDE